MLKEFKQDQNILLEINFKELNLDNFQLILEYFADVWQNQTEIVIFDKELANISEVKKLKQENFPSQTLYLWQKTKKTQKNPFINVNNKTRKKLFQEFLSYFQKYSLPNQFQTIYNTIEYEPKFKGILFVQRN